jgi:hypothetical protein
MGARSLPRQGAVGHRDPGDTVRRSARVRCAPILAGRGARERILAEKDPARLERWLERAIPAATVAEVLDEPS